MISSRSKFYDGKYQTLLPAKQLELPEDQLAVRSGQGPKRFAHQGSKWLRIPGNNFH